MAYQIVWQSSMLFLRYRAPKYERLSNGPTIIALPLCWKFQLKMNRCHLRTNWRNFSEWVNQQQLFINRWIVVYIWQVEVDRNKGNPIKLAAHRLKIQSELCFSGDELWWIIDESVEAPPTTDMLLPNKQRSPTTEDPWEDLCSIIAQWYIC